jgi:hypothetical protein
VITQCFRFIILIASASLAGSAGQGKGTARFGSTKPASPGTDFPENHEGGMPAFQHSPILGHLPLVQMVWSLLLSQSS